MNIVSRYKEQRTIHTPDIAQNQYSISQISSFYNQLIEKVQKMGINIELDPPPQSRASTQEDILEGFQRSIINGLGISMNEFEDIISRRLQQTQPREVPPQQYSPHSVITQDEIEEMLRLLNNF